MAYSARLQCMSANEDRDRVKGLCELNADGDGLEGEFE